MKILIEVLAAVLAVDLVMLFYRRWPAMKIKTKERIIRWVVMPSPLLLLLFGLHPQQAQSYQTPPTFRVLWYPNGNPAWAGGTVYPEGWFQGQMDGDYFPTDPYSGPPVYIPGIMPQIIATNSNGQMIIDVGTNYCNTSNILGMAYTEQLYYVLGTPHWWPVPGSTNWAVMPPGVAEGIWSMTLDSLMTFNGFVWQVPVLFSNSYPRVYCPGSGTGGQ